MIRVQVLATSESVSVTKEIINNNEEIKVSETVFSTITLNNRFATMILL